LLWEKTKFDPLPITLKFGARNYIHEVSPKTKFGDDRFSLGFWQYVKYRGPTMFVTFLLFRNTPVGQTVQPIFTQNGLNDANSGTDLPFAVKIDTSMTPKH